MLNLAWWSQICQIDRLVGLPDRVGKTLFDFTGIIDQHPMEIPVLNKVDTTLFRSAMSRLGAAVHVITTESDGVRHGLTASAVCSVTDKPPTLLFCINRNMSSRNAFFVGGMVCINTLVHDQKEIASAFADRELLDRRFE